MTGARVQQRHAAIHASGIVDYTRLVVIDRVGTLARIKTHIDALLRPEITTHNGRIVGTSGPSLVAEFELVPDAVECVIKIQHRMAHRNAAVPHDKRVDFRIGVAYGELITENGSIRGAGVEQASQL